jgi:hypothetical protein
MSNNGPSEQFRATRLREAGPSVTLICDTCNVNRSEGTAASHAIAWGHLTFTDDAGLKVKFPSLLEILAEEGEV